VAWIGSLPSAPSYFNAEFSVQSVLAAVLYKFFGESGTLARLVAIAFSLLGIYPRLTVVNPSATDRDDRVVVAELDVPPPPRYGWFSGPLAWVGQALSLRRPPLAASAR